MNKLRTISGVFWLFKMAWRDARASYTRLLLFMSSIVLGIAAVVSIQLFSENLTNNIQRQSKALMGADFVIETDQVPNEDVQKVIDSLNADASEVSFLSMVAFPKNNGTRLVNVRGLQGAFPFYGTIETQPENAYQQLMQQDAAVVDATLLLQYQLQPGDSIKIGAITLPIAGSVESIPGSNAMSSSVAPTVIIPYKVVEATQLLQYGSRKEYKYYFNQPEADLQALEQIIEPQLDRQDADLDTHVSTSRRLGRRYENVGNFLNLAAFIALLLGCVGIASSVNIYIKEKLAAIAVLKCIGASRKQSFLIYLIQVATIGLLGGIIGTAIGVALQGIIPIALKEFLPFNVEIGITLQPLITGIGLGLIIAVLFALIPLIKTYYVSPLEVLRSGKSSKVGVGAQISIAIIITAVLFVFTYWLMDDQLNALGFILGVGFTFLILLGSASLMMRLIKKYFPRNGTFTLRQGLLNLYRPNNQTIVLIIAIGIGTFLISTLYFTKDILLSKADLSETKSTANLILLDVQPDQVNLVQETIRSSDMPILDNIPLVTMRLHSINNKLVSDLRVDTTTTIRRWILNHEFRTTYRDSLADTEQILQGEWVAIHNPLETVKISISDNLAQDAQLTVGDPVVFNVQGVLMETVVGSIRQVDWTNLQLNFSIVFPDGILENAPQFNVLTTNAATPDQSARMQQKMVQAVPNVTIIDLRQVYDVVEDILNKVSWVINFMAFFSILTGIIVLIGSVRTSKYQRIKESVLLRTMGASNRQILKITAFEYFSLGILGSLLGILLALISSYLLALLVFKEPFIPSIIPFAVFLPAISIIVVIIGLSNIGNVLKSSPLEVLRKAA